MKTGSVHTEVLNPGSPPPCLETMQQCRGCFGWPNMIKAAYDNSVWRQYPLKCNCTGLVIKIVQIGNEKYTKGNMFLSIQ